MMTAAHLNDILSIYIMFCFVFCDSWWAHHNSTHTQFTTTVWFHYYSSTHMEYSV